MRRSDNSPLRRLTAGIAALIFVVAAALAAPPSFVADKIERFDGRRWAGLTLGVTTQDGVKKQFRNGRGDFSSSVEMQQDGAQGYKVSALYPNKDGSARLDGIAIRYASDADGLPLADLRATLGPGEELYPNGERYEPWKVVAYPQRGILLFALGEKASLVLLGYPERIAETTTLLAKDATPVAPFVDPHADEPRALSFRSIDIGFSLSGDLHARSEYSERRDIERDIRASARPGGLLRYDPGARSGSYRVSINGRYSRSKRSGEGSVSVSIDGDSPYGRVSGSGYESFKIEDAGDETEEEIEDTRYNRAVYAAMREAEEDVERKLARQGPPPIESFRRDWWDKLIDRYRFHTKGGAGSGSGGLL